MLRLLFRRKTPAPIAVPAAAPAPPAAPGPASPPAAASVASITGDEDVRWIEADDPENPFHGQGLRVLDCRSTALSHFSTTSDRSIAQRFLQLRTSDGRETLGQLPQPCLTQKSELLFSYPTATSASAPEGPLYLAREMEEKWDLFVHDRRLYIRRSWTGQLLHVAELQITAGTLHLTRLHSHADLMDDDPAYARTVVHFLLHSHLGGTTTVPFPILPRLAHHTPAELAAYAFNHYGRKGLWGVVV